MTLKDLGYTNKLEQFRIEKNLTSFEVGRIISENKERFIVKTPENEFEAELLGKIRFSAESRYDLPAVGDWVAFSEYDEGKGLIHAIFPRTSIIERKAVGKSGQVQIIATNIDCSLIVQAIDRDFNLNRLERYLTICHASKVDPVIVISKIDLVDDAKLTEVLDQIQKRIKNPTIITVSSHQKEGYKAIEAIIEDGKTYCLLGSSGVGKSTLLNHLMGEEVMKTSEISSSMNKGRHTTSHRELIVLKNGGIMIDNPGMREVGIADTSSGLEMTFDSIMEFAENCRFKDCTHTQEKGCAVLEALETGELDEEAYHNFRKMERERDRFEMNAIERKKKNREFGRMIKEVKKHRKKYKY